MSPSNFSNIQVQIGTSLISICRVRAIWFRFWKCAILLIFKLLGSNYCNQKNADINGLHLSQVQNELSVRWICSKIFTTYITIFLLNLSIWFMWQKVSHYWYNIRYVLWNSRYVDPDELSLIQISFSNKWNLNWFECNFVIQLIVTNFIGYTWIGPCKKIYR